MLYNTIDEDFPSGFEWSTKEEDDEEKYTSFLTMLKMH